MTDCIFPASISSVRKLQSSVYSLAARAFQGMTFLLLLLEIHRRHVSSEVPGKLYRKRTNTSTRTMNQHLLSALDMAFSQKIHCFKSTNRKGSGFLIGYIGRFDCQHPVFRQTFVLSIRTQTQT